VDVIISLGNMKKGMIDTRRGKNLRINILLKTENNKYVVKPIDNNGSLLLNITPLKQVI